MACDGIFTADVIEKKYLSTLYILPKRSCREGYIERHKICWEYEDVSSQGSIFIVSKN
jgi:hypothetical protein